MAIKDMSNQNDIAKYRLGILKLAKKLDNVAEACRQYGISRTTFYRYAKRYKKSGLAGLRNLSSAHHSDSQATLAKAVKKVLYLSSIEPDFGCRQISNMLKSEGIFRSHQTVQNILVKEGLGTRQQRLAKFIYSKSNSVGVNETRNISDSNQRVPVFVGEKL